MQSYHIRHIPGTVDACPLDGQMHLRLQVRRGLLRSASLIYNCDKNKWHEARLEAPMALGFTDSELEYYSVSVALTDTRFAYIFKLCCLDGSSLYYSEEGLSEGYDHALGYFSFFQYTSQFPCDMMSIAPWVNTAVCYQVFPERFARGSRSKDEGYINSRWGELPTPKSYFGGDLWGVAERLDYIEALGASCLYLTPVFTSPTNHKYETVDYESVDPAFGGNEALKELIDKAHSRGIRVIMDGVFNHCSARHPFFLDALEKGMASAYFDWFFIKPDGSYLTFGSVKNMPKLNTGNTAVIEYFSGLALKWMRDYGVDGWRLDVSDEISHRFLRHFRQAVTEERPDAIIIGEDWHRAPRYLNGDEYDGVMNYGLTKALLDLLAFGNIEASAFRDRLVRLYHSYSIAAGRKLLNLIGSHDTHRFLTRTEGDRQKLRFALALMFFYPGIPCVYYGDEIGTEGGYDPDCRRCFDWDEKHWDSSILSLVRELAAMKKEPPLSVGSFSIDEQGGIVTVSRRACGKAAVLRLNCKDYSFHIIKEEDSL